MLLPYLDCAECASTPISCYASPSTSSPVLATPHFPSSSSSSTSTSNSAGPQIPPSFFCCDDVSCFSDPTLNHGSTGAGEGEIICDLGDACPSASFVGWDLDCVECEREAGDLDEKGKGKAREECMECEAAVSRPDEDIFKGLSQSTIDEILACCCCGPEYQNPTWSISQHHAHTFPDVTAQIPFLPSTPPVVTAFACKWHGCQLSFATKEQLGQHVNVDHIGLVEPSYDTPMSNVTTPLALASNGSGTSSLVQTPQLPPFDFGGKCQWDECATDSSTVAHNRATLESGAQATSALVDHLLLEHLAKLEPTNVPFNAVPHLAQLHDSLHSLGHAGHVHLSNFAHPHPPPLHQHDLPVPALLPPPPTPHARACSHPHDSTASRRHKHSHTRARSHGHPYGVHSRASPSSTPSIGTPTGLTTSPPAETSLHFCKWKGCTSAFTSSQALMEHLGETHVGSGKASYSCEWEGCDRTEELGKGFVQRQKVMRHLQTHTGDRPFVCEVCKKSFSEATTLTQHMRVHTNERPYKCTFEGCKKSFALASALTIHLRTHTGDKPFRCPHPGCRAAFSESSNLSKHIKTHKGDKPYTCAECGKSFARSDQKARHEKTHEREREKVQ